MPPKRRLVQLMQAPLLALTVIALVQIFLAQIGPLTPWKGGGFGMFSSLDRMANRPLRVAAIGPAGEQELNVLPGLLREVQQTQAWPTERRMRWLAKLVAARLSPRSRGVRAIRVEISRLELDTERAQLRYVPWRSVEVPLEQRGPGAAP